MSDVAIILMKHAKTFFFGQTHSSNKRQTETSVLFSDWLASPVGRNNFISVVGFFFFSLFPDLPTSNNVSLSPPVQFPFGIFTPPPSA